ncbi:MAG: hypothetical protein IT292_05030 [Deltaproteobacteria bacterium]|nr:hypothetical protein [Deltaproteobacteria bacterium]
MFEVINRLNDSLDELEKSIQVAKKALLSRKEVPLDLVRRVESYESIIGKQRLLSEELLTLVINAKWDDVARHVKLINGLSAMIHEDANSLLSNLEIEVVPGPIPRNIDTSLN